jgi:rhamnogalacturonan endolyase
MMLPEPVRFNGAVTLTGDLLIPGSPTIVLNGHPSYGGTIDGGGAAMPMDHSVILNGGASLGHVLQRTDGVALPHAEPPPSPLGTRDVVLNDEGDDPGSFSTIRDLTLNGNAGPISVPAGTYGSFTANGSRRFVLGVAGSTEPAVYNLQSLRLNGSSSVQIAGPVILTVQDAVVLNGSMGAAANPGWLLLRIAGGGLTLNGGVAVHGFVTAPAGTVTINGNSRLTGGVAADRLVISGNGRLNLLQ